MVLKKVIKSSSISVAFSLVQALLSIFFAGYSLKVLGVEFFGRYQLAQAVYLFLFPFLGFTILYAALTNFVAESASSDKHESSFKMLRVCLGYFILANGFIFSLVLVYFKSPFNNNGTFIDIFILMAIVYALFEQMVLLLSAYFNGKGWFVANQLILGVTGVLMQVSVLASVIFTKSQLVYVYFMAIAGFIKVATFYAVLVIKERKLLTPLLLIADLKKMKLFSWSAYISAMSTPFMTQGDKIILSYFGGITNLPFYSLAQRALLIIHSFVYNITYTIFPILSAEKENAIIKATSIDNKVRWSISSLSMMLYSSVVVFFPIFLTIVAGPEISKKSVIFLILASANGLIVSNATVATMSLMAFKKMKVMAINSWVNGFTILSLLFILTSLFGAVGTAASKLGHLFQMFFTNYHYGKTLNIKNIFAIYRPILGSIIIFPIISIIGLKAANSEYGFILTGIYSGSMTIATFGLWIAIEIFTVTGKEGLVFLKECLFNFLKIGKSSES